MFRSAKPYVMKRSAFILTAVLLSLLHGCHAVPPTGPQIDPGERPRALAAQVPDDNLSRVLLACADGPFRRSRFSIAHRGAPFAYPEHTREGYLAAAQMGAGLGECDVTFTADNQLVCRHSQCDLHTTTNILQTPLAGKCSSGFTPAQPGQPAAARCCTSDITLAEFKTLCGRRDIVNPAAQNINEYLSIPAEVSARSAPWAAQPVQCGSLLTHAESITLFNELGLDFIPELKQPMVDMPHNGMSAAAYTTALIEDYRSAGIAPERVFPQSFNPADITLWLQTHPAFGRQAVWLDARGRDPGFKPTVSRMQALKAMGLNIIAPPMPMLLTLAEDGSLQPSPYARAASAAGLDIITWTLEAGLATDPNNWLYMNLPGFMTSESRMLEVLHALHTEVGVRGVFSDWPGTVTYYANCMALP